MYHRTKKHLTDWFIPHPGNNHHPHALKHKHLAAYSYTMLMAKAVLIGILFLSFPTAGQFSTVTQSRIAELANQARASAGLAPVRVNTTLTRAAELKLNDMFAQGYFAHISPSGIVPWEWFKQAGYTYTYAGENLAMNFTEAEEAHAAWLASPTHRDNILNSNYEEIGVAVGIGQLEGEQVTLVVQLFGKTFVPAIAGAEVSPLAAKAPTPTAPAPIPAPIPAPQPVIPSQPASIALQEAPEPDLVPLTEPKAPVVESEPKLTPEISVGAEQEVLLQQSAADSFLAGAVRFLRKFIWLIVGLVALALILKIIIRVRVQHKAIISHGLVVIGIGLLLLLIQIHFLEKISGPVVLF